MYSCSGEKNWHELNSTSTCTGVTGHFKGRMTKEWGEPELSKIRERKTTKSGKNVGLCETSECNWLLSKLDFCPPTETRRQGLNLQVLAGTNSEFFWQH